MKKIVAINCSPRSTWNTYGRRQRALENKAQKPKSSTCTGWTMFNPEHKKERHETVFPEDKKKAFALGEQMVNDSWEE